MRKVEIALIEYINSKPEGHLLREIAERQLVDIRQRGLKYVDPKENEKLGKVKRVYTPPNKRKLTLEELKEVIGHNCRYLRIRRGWTLKELGAKIGASESLYRYYENGHTLMPLPAALNMCRIFSLPVEVFTSEKLPIKKAPK